MSKPQPIYKKVQDYIRSEIDAGTFTPGDRIPTEIWLMDKFGASRMTVHRAIRGLSDDGLVQRIPGSGSYVAEKKSGSSVLKIADIAEEIAERGHSHRCRVVQLEEVKSDAELATRFNITLGHPIFFSSVVHYEGAIPLQLENKFVNPYTVPDYLAQDFNSMTTYSYIQKIAPISRAEQSIHAVMPDRETQRHLDIEAEVPCLLIERRTWSGPTVATNSRLIYPGNRYHLKSVIDTV